MAFVAWLPWAVLALAALLGAVGLAIAARRRVHALERLLAANESRLAQLQRQFERFVPADVVERLTGDGAGGAEVAPERRQVTLLFADLRGFTALCDRLDPALMVQLLNGYFERMDAAIAQHHGHLTELVGDGLLALFGALEANPWQARDAVLAALDMRAALARYNDELAVRGLPALQFGIGIHGGEVVTGVMGAGELSKFSVTGDPINLASRVEGLTREHGVDLLITEEIVRHLDGRFRLRAMPPVPVKGKREAVATWHVEGIEVAAAQLVLHSGDVRP